MARRKSSRSDGGCLGVIIVLVVIAGLVKSIVEYLPYVAGAIDIVIGCIFLTWVIVKFINKNKVENISGRTTSNSIQRPVNEVADSNVANHNYVSDSSDILFEVDRQIKEVLNRRVNTENIINSLDKQIAKHNNPLWNKINGKHIPIRMELENEKKIQSNKLAASIFVFHESSTSSFERMKSALRRLDKAPYKTYDDSPALGSLIYDYQPIGADMNFIKFDIEPICISISSKVFCLTPHYIVEFTKKGKYVATYRTSTFVASTANGSWTERVAHQTWLHTRVDGMPDRRYRYNPIQTYYTNVPHTVYNMLDFRISGFEVKYEIDAILKNQVIQAVTSYAATVVMDSYDPVHHIIRLLKLCEPTNSNIINIESTIEE